MPTSAWIYTTSYLLLVSQKQLINWWGGQQIWTLSHPLALCDAHYNLLQILGAVKNKKVSRHFVCHSTNSSHTSIISQPQSFQNWTHRTGITGPTNIVAHELESHGSHTGTFSARDGHSVQYPWSYASSTLQHYPGQRQMAWITFLTLLISQLRPAPN